MVMFSPFADPSRIDPRTKANVKAFIIRACNNEVASWPGYPCVIWDDGKGQPITVKSGANWIKYEGELLVGHDPSRIAPMWAPGALAAIARFFALGEDSEVRTAIMEMATKLVADVFQPIIQSYLAQSYEGNPVHKIAVNTGSRIMAGEYPPETPDGPSIWRTVSGEEVDVFAEGENWVVFAI